MPSPCGRRAAECCASICCISLHGISDIAATSSSSSRSDFVISAISALLPNTQFTNHESLPSFSDSFSTFAEAFPHYLETMPQADEIREAEYPHLSNHICLDYSGVGLFSHSQIRNLSSSASSPRFFTISYKSASLKFDAQNGEQESGFESSIKKKIMTFLKISADDYFMVCTSNRTTAFSLVAETYPFQSNNRLLTVYDYESEAVTPMSECAQKRGAKVMSASFTWPSLGIHLPKLKRMLGSRSKKKKRGLFVFPLMSRMTGTRYPNLLIKMAQERGWHVALDTCTLGPKDMDTMGMALLQPDFIICSFFKVFGLNPSGFAGLFIRKSSQEVLKSSVLDRSIGLVAIVPEEDQEADNLDQEAEIELRGLHHADSLGLPVIQIRLRCIINWLVIALMKLRHPDSRHGDCLVRIYGPNVRFDRGSAIAFNVFDWKGEKVEPSLVQKLADRSNISLNCGFLQNICLSDHKQRQDRHGVLEKKGPGTSVLGRRRKKETGDLGIAVVSASLAFLVNFEDAYRFWAFVAKFLDADFVEKERWRYVALNQRSVEI
ncbi:hypothetical protein KSP40_PGU019095 [Platanthera guangdongensis]|uniref:Molybdenum cofactor sulfurase n=1 Tax=Platanthera guangdongensis TaxID=2320717 RepID=A0ABR2MS21_9ASPA